MEEPVKEKNNWEEYLEDFKNTCKKIEEMVLDLYNGNEKILEDMERSPKTAYFVSIVFPKLKEEGRLSDELSDRIETKLKKLGWIENKQFIAPKKSLFVNTMDFHEIIKNSDRFTGDGDTITVNDKLGIQNYIQIIFPEDNPDINKLSVRDRAYLNGAFNFYLNGIREFSDSALYQASRQSRPSNKKALEDMNKQISKLRTTLISLCWNNQAKQEHFKAIGKDITEEDLNKLTIKDEDYLLPLTRTTVSYNGKEISGYRFKGEPCLLEQARLQGRLFVISNKDRNIQALSQTDKNIAITDYLIYRIKTSPNNPVLILLDTLYKECEIITDDMTDNASQKARDAARSNIDKILTQWKTEGEDIKISSWKWTKSRPKSKGDYQILKNIKNAYTHLEIVLKNST